jgi:transcription elongation factor GreA
MLFFFSCGGIMAGGSREVKERIEALKAEIEALEREAREEIPAQMASAQAVGPVRENADMYLVAGRAHYVQGRIENLRQQLKALRALSRAGAPKDRAGYGSTLELLDLNTGQRRRMRIASPEAVEEGDTCSLASPMGQALAGKRPGDEVEVAVPSGHKLYRIESLSS